MSNQESRLQQACIKWVRYQYPDLIIYAVPNGGKRNAVTGAILKAEGVLAGVADLFVAKATAQHHGLYIEMKTAKGRQTASELSSRQSHERATATSFADHSSSSSR